MGPVQGSAKTLEELKTFSLELSKKQSTDLGIVLLAAAQEWDTVTVTVFRKTRQVTLTTAVR